MSEPTIRHLGREDIDRVHALWQAARLPFRADGRDSPSALGDDLDSEQCFLIGAEDGDSLIGVALGSDDHRKGWINRLAVAGGHRRRGIARILIRACEEKFLRRGIGLAACLIEDGNQASIDLFTTAGYRLHRDIVYLWRPLDVSDW